MTSEKQMNELLRKKGEHLFHRESQTLEFKEQFNLASLADYFRDFAAFANNRGGYLVFGVTDSPRTPVGMSDKSLAMFEKVDPERITQFLLEIFSASISWSQSTHVINGHSFGVFEIERAQVRPVIAKKDEGKGQLIRNGDIYYRYGGRTQRIQSAELEAIINDRIERTNKDWIDHVRAIGSGGPGKAILLRSEDDIAGSKNAPMVVDRQLARKIKFIKEGQFNEKAGAATLKVVGDVVPIDTVEIEKVVKENLLKAYPLTAMEMNAEVRKKLPKIKQHEVWKAISDNGLKGNEDYSAYNFRNRNQEENFRKTGRAPSTVPVIYNQASVDFLVKILTH